MTARRYVLSPALADVLHVDGEAIVLLEETLLRLGPLAAEVVACCTTPRTAREVIDHCVAVLGPEPDGSADAVVTAALDQLIDSLILVPVDS